MIMDTLDLILAPWSTPEQVSWNLQIAVMGTLVCLSCGIVGTFIVPLEWYENASTLPRMCW